MAQHIVNLSLLDGRSFSNKTHVNGSLQFKSWDLFFFSFAEKEIVKRIKELSFEELFSEISENVISDICQGNGSARVSFVFLIGQCVFVDPEESLSHPVDIDFEIFPVFKELVQQVFSFFGSQ